SVKLLTPDAPTAMHQAAHAFEDGILALSDRGRDFSAIARIGLDGSFRLVRAPRRGIGGPAVGGARVAPERVIDDLAVAGAQVAYAVNVDGRSEARILSGGKDVAIEGLPPGDLATDLIGDSLAVAPCGTVAVAWARFDAPSAVYVAPPGRPAKLVVPPQLAGLSTEGLPDDELVSWRSFDERTIPGFLLRPRGAPKGPRPTVVQVHG